LSFDDGFVLVFVLVFLAISYFVRTQALDFKCALLEAIGLAVGDDHLS
jgi:hypothetical protein